MALENCSKCGGRFLTEADPYIVHPKPTGVELQCLRCAMAVARELATDADIRARLEFGKRQRAVANMQAMVKIGRAERERRKKAETNVKALVGVAKELLRVGQFYPSAIEIDMYAKSGKNGGKNGEELKEMLIAAIAKAEVK